MSKLSTLPHTIQLEQLKYLDSDKILQYCEDGTLPERICKDFYFWRDLAVKDFNYPADAFPFIDEDTPVERYLRVKSYVPSKEQMRNLNALAVLYDFTDNNLESTFTPLDKDSFEKFALEGETKESLSELFDELEADYESLPVSGSNYVNLTATYGRYLYVFDTKQNFNQKASTVNSMVRGYKDEPVAYADVLQNSRNLFPPDSSYPAVKEYKFKGFTELGVPQIEVDVDWG